MTEEEQKMNDQVYHVYLICPDELIYVTDRPLVDNIIDKYEKAFAARPSIIDLTLISRDPFIADDDFFED